MFFKSPTCNKTERSHLIKHINEGSGLIVCFKPEGIMGYRKLHAANVFLAGDEEKKMNVIGFSPTADIALLGHCSVRE